MTARLVVVGDVLLDRDVDGAVQRVCPDAPAPVLDERSSVERPGGAGLAALLAAGQGFEVHLVTALADDAGGARLSEMLTAAGVQLYALPLTGTTPEKIRLRTRGQVLLRLDRGGPPTPPGEPSEAVLEALAGAAAIVVSDYGRGVARQPTLRAALVGAAAPIVWDPHPRGAAAVPGVRLATPNETEVRQLTGEISGVSRLSAASRGAQELRRRWRAAAVAVTMGGEGALLCHAGSTPLVVATTGSAQGDTCGAGDRFAAVAAAALADGAVVSEAVQAAVEQATAYVAAGGVTAALRAGPGVHAPASAHAPALVHGGRSRSAPVHAAPPGRAASGAGPEGAHRIGAHAAGGVAAAVRARGGTVVATGGCFDLLHAGHVAALQAARRLGDCLVVCLNSDASVASLKGPERPVVPQSDRARLLAALGCVDAVVIFEESTPHAVLSWLRPDIWVKGGDYAGGGAGEADLPEAALVRRWGGQTAIVPYLDGHSTTGMIAAARSGRGRGAKEPR
ncbi:rfaE bifunctional protein, domain I/rfaE bifunctional protein, domain II [Micromonospora pattaloongensis]|uniref:RfaE bifunctional protein, domain I/rfaE bifunctional protein, domain II n=1 Tax=Micromonospora pattaloongensis TaxID=405436 RepID=A0A1H3S6F8_9ACTN|nr:PfkB family carbohydrate kinase [Micromonospora pattaloongensis]SDZ33703.1 rfaE bifunctional protein, domain I/rfaE bifunctional protein, domain II [Micromonospora pattaloongensis]